MKKIKLGQIGIGHNHAEGKMLATQKFPELFEVIGYAETNEEWVKERGSLPCYKHLQRLGIDEIVEKLDVILVECDVWNLTKTAKKCVASGKHVHIDKPAGGTLEEFEEMLNIAKERNLTVQLGYMYRYNFAVLEYEKAIARITTLSVEVNGWGMRRFAVMGSKGTVEIKPIELNVKMTKSTTDIAANAYADMYESVDVQDVPTLSRYDEMMKDLHLSVIGEKKNPYSYEHELAVQRTLCRITGEN